MSPLTSEDRNAMLLLPAIRAIRPARSIRRNRAVDQAISPDGYIKSRAILPATNRIDGDDATGTTDSSSSTGTPKTYLSTTFSLPDGTWRVVLKVQVTGSLSGSSTLNVLARLNGTAGNNVPVAIAAANQLATGRARVQLDNVGGGSDLFAEVLYRPSAGTATVQCGSYEWYAERM